MMRSKILDSCFHSAVLLLALLQDAVAFAPSIKQSRPFIAPKATTSDSSSSSLGPRSIEEARRAFEDLLHLNDDDESSQLFLNDADIEHNSLLTTVGRYRLTVEMDLLESLRESDAAVDELLHLWITERDQESAAQIFAMQANCTRGMIKEEQQLLKMMQRHPTWAEPVIRLATLLFFKGRTEESYQLAIYALELKPWHIEAPQLLIMISLRNQDLGQALFWARQSLPALRSQKMAVQGGDKDLFHRKRQQWVENALRAAKKQLEEAERLREEADRRSSKQQFQSSPWDETSQQAWQ